MKKNVLSRAFSLFLALLMVLGTVPVTVISAYAEAAPEMLVTSLTELYSGDETRAREDLEALSAAGLLGADGKLVALDIRENGESRELSALAERIAKGETVGEITVNGNAATPEQIVQIAGIDGEKLPEIGLSVANLEIEVEEGKVYRSSFTIESENNIPMKGYIYSTSDKMDTEISDFEGVKVEIPFYFKGNLREKQGRGQ